MGLAAHGADELGQFGHECSALGGEPLEGSAQVGVVGALGGFVKTLLTVAGGLEQLVENVDGVLGIGSGAHAILHEEIVGGPSGREARRAMVESQAASG